MRKLLGKKVSAEPKELGSYAVTPVSFPSTLPKIRDWRAGTSQGGSPEVKKGEKGWHPQILTPSLQMPSFLLKK